MKTSKKKRRQVFELFYDLLESTTKYAPNGIRTGDLRYINFLPYNEKAAKVLLVRLKFLDYKIIENSDNAKLRYARYAIIDIGNKLVLDILSEDMGEGMLGKGTKKVMKEITIEELTGE